MNDAAAGGRAIRRLVVHHTAGPKSSTVEQIRRMHVKERKFRDIGYHAVIPGNGTIQSGRPERMMGAHAQGANADSLGVALSGNFENEHPNAAQIDSLVLLLATWCRNYDVSPDHIHGHRDVGTTATACPGRHLYQQLPAIRARVRRHLAEEARLGICLARPIA